MDSFFPEQKVIIIKDKDFNLESDEKITIKNKMLSLVLFHDNSNISRDVSKIWQKLANNIPGIVFYACNLIDSRDIAQEFSLVALDETSPYREFARNRTPFILVYRNGKPQMSYHDVISEVRLINFCSKIITGKVSNKPPKVIEDKNYESDGTDDDSLPTKIK